MLNRRPAPGYETPAHLRDKGPRGQSEEQFKRELEHDKAEHMRHSGAAHSHDPYHEHHKKNK